jgi:hypothetical protein
VREGSARARSQRPHARRGIELEPGRAQIVREFAEIKPSAWKPNQVAELKAGMAADATGVPLKLVFGSDFPYRETEEKIPWRNRGTGLKPSLALGGCLKNYFAARGWEILELTRQPKPGTRGIKFQLGAEIPPAAFEDVSALVHCAYDFKPLRRDEIRAVNVDGARKLFQAARAAGIGKIICISAISAYDGCRSLYGKAKLEIEKLALENGALVIRPGLVYGNDSGGMFGKLAAQVRNSSIIPMIGGRFATPVSRPPRGFVRVHRALRERRNKNFSKSFDGGARAAVGVQATAFGNCPRAK